MDVCYHTDCKHAFLEHSYNTLRTAGYICLKKKNWTTTNTCSKMGPLGFTIENSTFATTQPWKHGMDYWSSFELYPEWTGGNFYVFKGIAYHQKDYWSGSMVAVKTFRHIKGTVDDWSSYKRRCDVGRSIAANFNKYLTSVTCNTRLTFATPIDAVMENISDVMRITRFFMRYDKIFTKNEVVLFEDLLEGDFKKFVTAQGFRTGHGSEMLDAFCHFTYHFSREHLVVCNLKGIEEEGEYTLTNPTIHSRDGCYGDKDKRDDGISDFFKNHICNAVCENFLKPVTGCNEGEPSAPVFGTIDNTLSKAFEAEEGENLEEPKNEVSELMYPPKYMSVDPHAPPPYDTCMDEK